MWSGCVRGIGPRTIGITTSGTGVWPDVEAGVEETCIADAMGIDGTGDVVVGVVDKEAVVVEELTGGYCPQSVWVKVA